MAEALRLAVPFLADALVILGVFIMTVGVYGAIRMPDTFTKLHAMSKAVFLGVVSLCASSAVTGDPQVIFRVALISAFLIVTTPISAFVVSLPRDVRVACTIPHWCHVLADETSQISSWREIRLSRRRDILPEVAAGE